MAIVSKYPAERVEKIIEKLMTVLIEEQAEPDLSLMCLGNLVSEVLKQQIPAAAQADIIDNFTHALKKSVVKSA